MCCQSSPVPGGAGGSNGGNGAAVSQGSGGFGQGSKYGTCLTSIKWHTATAGAGGAGG